MMKSEFPAMMSDAWIALVLDYDPFDGDFGDGTERTLRDDVKPATRRGTCRECKHSIVKGEIVRFIKKVDSEGFYGGRCCQACCTAMAQVSFALSGGFEDEDDDDYAGAIDAMTARHALAALPEGE